MTFNQEMSQGTALSTGISLASLQMRSKPKPGRFFVYGTHGIGKTTFAQKTPRPVILQTEESEVQVPTFGLLRSYDQFMGAVTALYQEDHDFQTVVVDSVDWLEPLINAEVCRQNNWGSIEAPGYGKGYAAAMDTWRVVLDGFSALRDDKGMTIMLLGHSEVKRFDSPENEPYDRYQPKLSARASALLQEHVDYVLFANYKVFTQATDKGFNKKAVRGVGTSDRFLFTTERPAFLAKNRANLPESLPLDWNSLASLIPFYQSAAQNTEGESRAA